MNFMFFVVNNVSVIGAFFLIFTDLFGTNFFEGRYYTFCTIIFK